MVGIDDDVVLLSSLRRLGGGFAGKDMKKRGEWLMVWAYREEARTSGSWSLKYPLSLSVATRGDRDKTAIGVEHNGEAAYSICSHTNGPDIFRS